MIMELKKVIIRCDNEKLKELKIYCIKKETSINDLLNNYIDEILKKERKSE